LVVTSAGFTLLEPFADRAQSQNKAAIDGLEWVDAFGEGALAERPGSVWIALKDGLLHRFEKLIRHDGSASSAFWPSGITRASSLIG
jgi:hypothetical protein